MYESLTYEELKNLPEDKKIEAWKELHTAYPENKALAQKLGAATIAVVNNVKKYVFGEPIGRASKKNKQESQQHQEPELPQEIKQETQEEPEQKLQQEQQQEDKPKRKYNRKAKFNIVTELPKAEIEANIEPEPNKSEVSIVPINNVSENFFSIVVNKIISGESAQVLLSGLANTLTKDQQYIIEIKIMEK